LESGGERPSRTDRWNVVQDGCATRERQEERAADDKRASAVHRAEVVGQDRRRIRIPPKLVVRRQVAVVPAAWTVLEMLLRPGAGGATLEGRGDIFGERVEIDDVGCGEPTRRSAAEQCVVECEEVANGLTVQPSVARQPADRQVAELQPRVRSEVARNGEIDIHLESEHVATEDSRGRV